MVKPLAITPGEPAGIGPDIVLMLATQGFEVPVVAIANKTLLESRAAQLGLAVSIIEWQAGTAIVPSAGELFVLDQALASPPICGELDVSNAPYVLNCLDVAIDGSLNGLFAGVVTGPVHKGVINDAGIKFSGHTEHFQQRCSVDRVVMMLASSRMKVALATTHLPLKDVSDAITQQSLHEVIRILLSDLTNKFACQRPRVLIAGLNPHAGEGGHMGREEIEVIQPVLDRFAEAEADLIGPLPADTLFTPKYLEHADAVLAMFHDQGLPVLKYDGFGESINITLGLPIIRTSVDHGTAIDIAGTGQADTGSLKCAIDLAASMARASVAQ